MSYCRIAPWSQRRSLSTSFSSLYLNYYLTKAQAGGHLLRLNLNNSKQLLGVLSSRGTRDYNEDRCKSVTLELPQGNHLRTMKREANRAYFGVFDGHGGPLVSEWLADQLHQKIESVTLDDFSRILSTLRSYRGYFRRFKIPPVLSGCVDEQGVRKPNVSNNDLSLEQRLTLAFLDADVECLDLLRDDGPDGYHEGSTGSVAIIEPQDEKAFWESEHYDIVVGHVGDTRILLCDASSGQVVTLTTGDHHPGNPNEQDRLRKYAGFVTTDSWGDDRILGMLATSRAFGDAKLKRYGVSSEPDVVRHTIGKDNPAAFLVLVTDGLTSVMSDQEIVDIVKKGTDPTMSAKKLVDIADQYGTEDNCTAMVVRLKDWGTRMHDLTQDLREYRLANSSMSNRQSW
ncbi:phosphatase 2C-like domain-containing protein [Fennellomyces sp. T-0311]|nr:phosphatase 2C-like domain-containing protein [Fennellomyces sp. T-0311]